MNITTDTQLSYISLNCGNSDSRRYLSEKDPINQADVCNTIKELIHHTDQTLGYEIDEFIKDKILPKNYLTKDSIIDIILDELDNYSSTDILLRSWWMTTIYDVLKN